MYYKNQIPLALVHIYIATGYQNKGKWEENPREGPKVFSPPPLPLPFSRFRSSSGCLPTRLDLFAIIGQEVDQPVHAPAVAHGVYLGHCVLLGEAVVNQLADLVPDNFAPAEPRPAFGIGTPPRTPLLLNGFYRRRPVQAVLELSPHLPDSMEGAITNNRGHGAVRREVELQ